MSCITSVDGIIKYSGHWSDWSITLRCYLLVVCQLRRDFFGYEAVGAFRSHCHKNNRLLLVKLSVLQSFSHS